MFERKNHGIAVADAKRLSECYHELSEGLAALPALDGDRALWEFDWESHAVPDQEDRAEWIHRRSSNDVALYVIRGAFRDGRLQLWTYLHSGPAVVDHNELRELTFATFRKGIYLPDNRLIDVGLADRPLWVKNSDWQRFLIGALASRNDNEPELEQLSFSDDERREWMLSHADLSVDEAHRAYKGEPRSDGTKQHEWRTEWRAVIGRSRGGRETREVIRSYDFRARFFPS